MISFILKYTEVLISARATLPGNKFMSISLVYIRVHQLGLYEHHERHTTDICD
jgi:hypothetical protein